MTQPQLSIQLYTVNTLLESDLDGTLARLAAMGIRQVEAYAFVDRAEQLAEAFAKHGLQAKTGHAPLASDEISASAAGSSLCRRKPTCLRRPRPWVWST